LSQTAAAMMITGGYPEITLSVAPVNKIGVAPRSYALLRYLFGLLQHIHNARIYSITIVYAVLATNKMSMQFI
jgi:hypothetical protein